MLWDKVAASGGKQEERHAEVLGLCRSLKEELHTNTDKDSMGQWVGSLLEQRLSLLRAEMEEQTERPQQVRLWRNKFPLSGEVQRNERLDDY